MYSQNDLRKSITDCTLFVALAAAAISAPAARAAAPTATELRENVAVKSEILVENDSMTAFRIDVPPDAVLMKIKVSDSPLILDILARREEPIEDPLDADYHSHPDNLETELSISRQSRPRLESATYYVGIGYLASEPPVVHKRPVKSIPFTLVVTFERAKVDGVLTVNEKTVGRVAAETGSVRTFAIDVPAEAKALRIDLDEVDSDLDILARFGEPIINNDEADHTAISGLGRESLIITPSSNPPLKAGRWYVNVVHPVDTGEADFAVYASFDPAPPAALLAIPEMAQPTDNRRRAILATVDVSTENGGASGTIVSAGGLVLTNHHVVAEVAEHPAEKHPVVIGATLDPRQPAREVFRGRVVAFDKKRDLALVQIETGFYGQPLPPNYRFPVIALGDAASMEIGDRISVVGFPFIGGTSGRVSVTLTQGVVSGFEKTPVGTLIKTDANVSPGSSGGAALDDQWRLIGVPTSENVDVEAVSRMSYIHPLTLLPDEWRKKIAPAAPAAPPAANK